MEEEARRKEAWGGEINFNILSQLRLFIHVLSIRLLIYNKGSNGLT